jgi:uncharacterized membrane protein YiaA
MKQDKVFAFYKRLISLYPQAFRERFGDSMEQTFRDVCNEREGKFSSTFVISTFAETFISVIKENVEGASLMNYWLKNTVIVAIVSLVFIGIGAFMAFSETHESPPPPQNYLLIAFMNLVVMMLILTPIVSGLRSTENIAKCKWFAVLGLAMLFGAILNAPFAFMEWFNNPRIQSGEFQFPYLLFIGLWFPPTLIFLGVTPIVRLVRAGENVIANPISLILRVAFLGVIAFSWINLVRDQMPCFLGVPNCD